MIYSIATFAITTAGAALLALLSTLGAGADQAITVALALTVFAAGGLTLAVELAD